MSQHSAIKIPIDSFLVGGLDGTDFVVRPWSLDIDVPKGDRSRLTERLKEIRRNKKRDELTSNEDYQNISSEVDFLMEPATFNSQPNDGAFYLEITPLKELVSLYSRPHADKEVISGPAAGFYKNFNISATKKERVGNLSVGRCIHPENPGWSRRDPRERWVLIWESPVPLSGIGEWPNEGFTRTGYNPDLNLKRHSRDTWTIMMFVNEKGVQCLNRNIEAAMHPFGTYTVLSGSRDQRNRDSARCSWINVRYDYSCDLWRDADGTARNPIFRFWADAIHCASSGAISTQVVEALQDTFDTADDDEFYSRWQNRAEFLVSKLRVNVMSPQEYREKLRSVIQETFDGFASHRTEKRRQSFLRRFQIEAAGHLVPVGRVMSQGKWLLDDLGEESDNHAEEVAVVLDMPYGGMITGAVIASTQAIWELGARHFDACYLVFAPSKSRWKKGSTWAIDFRSPRVIRFAFGAMERLSIQRGETVDAEKLLTAVKDNINIVSPGERREAMVRYRNTFGDFEAVLRDSGDNVFKMITRTAQILSDSTTLRLMEADEVLLRYPDVVTRAKVNVKEFQDRWNLIGCRDLNELEENVTVERCYTDGCGMMHPELARELTQEVSLIDCDPDPEKVLGVEENRELTQITHAQIRCGGAKGMVSVNAWMDRMPGVPKGTKLILYDSQVKFDTSSKFMDLRIADWPKALIGVDMNFQVLLQMDPFVPRAFWHSKLVETLFTSALPFLGHSSKIIHNNDRGEVLAGTDLDSDKGSWAAYPRSVFNRIIADLAPVCRLAHLVESNVNLHNDLFLSSVTRLGYARRLSGLVRKIRLPIDFGLYLFGTCDHQGLLTPYQILVNFDGSFLDEDVIVYRNPVYHAGDIRLLTAVDPTALLTDGSPKYPHLHEYYSMPNTCTDQLIFSVIPPYEGSISMAGRCGGGDLDGDKFVVIWGLPKVLRKDKCRLDKNGEISMPDPFAEPMDMDIAKGILPHYTKESVVRDELAKSRLGDVVPDKVKQSEGSGDVCKAEEEVRHPVKDYWRAHHRAFLEIAQDTSLGNLSHAHVASADSLGIFAKEAVTLAHIANMSVDTMTSGTPIDFNACRENLLIPDEYPDYLSKANTAQYASSTINGEIYDMTKGLAVAGQLVDVRPSIVEYKFSADNRWLKYNREVLTKSFNTQISIAQDALERYRENVQTLLSNQEPRPWLYEVDLLFGRYNDEMIRRQEHDILEEARMGYSAIIREAHSDYQNLVSSMNSVKAESDHVRRCVSLQIWTMVADQNEEEGLLRLEIGDTDFNLATRVSAFRFVPFTRFAARSVGDPMAIAWTIRTELGEDTSGDIINVDGQRQTMHLSLVSEELQNYVRRLGVKPESKAWHLMYCDDLFTSCVSEAFEFFISPSEADRPVLGDVRVELLRWLNAKISCYMVANDVESAMSQPQPVDENDEPGRRLLVRLVVASKLLVTHSGDLRATLQDLVTRLGISQDGLPLRPSLGVTTFIDYLAKRVDYFKTSIILSRILGECDQMLKHSVQLTSNLSTLITRYPTGFMDHIRGKLEKYHVRRRSTAVFEGTTSRPIASAVPGKPRQEIISLKMVGTWIDIYMVNFVLREMETMSSISRSMLPLEIGESTFRWKHNDAELIPQPLCLRHVVGDDVKHEGFDVLPQLFRGLDEVRHGSTTGRLALRGTMVFIKEGHISTEWNLNSLPSMFMKPRLKFVVKSANGNTIRVEYSMPPIRIRTREDKWNEGATAVYVTETSEVATRLLTIAENKSSSKGALGVLLDFKRMSPVKKNQEQHYRQRFLQLESDHNEVASEEKKSSEEKKRCFNDLFQEVSVIVGRRQLEPGEQGASVPPETRWEEVRLALESSFGVLLRISPEENSRVIKAKLTLDKYESIYVESHIRKAAKRVDDDEADDTRYGFKLATAVAAVGEPDEHTFLPSLTTVFDITPPGNGASWKIHKPRFKVTLRDRVEHRQGFRGWDINLSIISQSASIAVRSLLYSITDRCGLSGNLEVWESVMQNDAHIDSGVLPPGQGCVFCEVMWLIRRKKKENVCPDEVKGVDVKPADSYKTLS